MYHSQSRTAYYFKLNTVAICRLFACAIQGGSCAYKSSNKWDRTLLYCTISYCSVLLVSLNFAKWIGQWIQKKEEAKKRLVPKIWFIIVRYRVACSEYSGRRDNLKTHYLKAWFNENGYALSPLDPKVVNNQACKKKQIYVLHTKYFYTREIRRSAIDDKFDTRLYCAPLAKSLNTNQRDLSYYTGTSLQKKINVGGSGEGAKF